MSTRAILSLPLMLVLSACTTSSFTTEDRQAVAGEVMATLADLTEAMNAHDPERVVAFYTDAPEFVFLGCTSTISGGATYKQMVGPTYSPERGATFSERVVSIQVLSPTTAVALQRGSSTKAPALFWTRVLEKQDGRWIITYEHQSWPGCPPPPDPHPGMMPADSTGLGR